jgi:hypothetical protein
MPGNENLRKKGKDKKRETFKKYGKNTAKGMRIKQEKMDNQLENKKNKLRK